MVVSGGGIFDTRSLDILGFPISFEEFEKLKDKGSHVP
jgi:hypothetical protein